MNPVDQGTIGLAAASFYFASTKYVVSIPLTDNQTYDLLVDDGTGVKTVQVKSSSSMKNGKFVVQLKCVRSNKTSNCIKKYDSSECNMLFVYTLDGSMYLFKSSDLAHITSAISVGNGAYSDFLVGKVSFGRADIGASNALEKRGTLTGDAGSIPVPSAIH